MRAHGKASEPLRNERNQDGDRWTLRGEEREETTSNNEWERLLQDRPKYPKRDKSFLRHILTVAAVVLGLLLFSVTGITVYDYYIKPVEPPPYSEKSPAEPPQTAEPQPTGESSESQTVAKAPEPSQPQNEPVPSPEPAPPAFEKKTESPPREATQAPPQTAKRSDDEPPPSPQKEIPVPRRPAPSGTYETVKVTFSRKTPSAAGELLDRVNPGVRLDVRGSEGDWLIVHSKKRDATVYIRRDDAMMVSGEPSRSQEELEKKWKMVELDIQEAILKRGIPNIKVSFIRDTAYLRGEVGSEAQQVAVEQAARTIPDVLHVHNGVWIRP